jgi:hypothetical protein
MDGLLNVDLLHTYLYKLKDRKVMNKDSSISLVTLENFVEKILKPVPDLPKASRKWLAGNVWWIVAIIVGLAALGILTAVSDMFKVLELKPESLNSLSIPVLNSKVWFFGQNASLILIFNIITLIIYSMAIAPLRAGLRKGWDLLFLMLVINTVWMMLNSLLTFSGLRLVSLGLLGFVSSFIAAYFLLQIKSRFIKTAKPKS